MPTAISPTLVRGQAIASRSTDTPTKFGHVPALDGIRAIAVLLVFFAHCGLDKVIPGGNGVTIFFFLSGYLITSLLVVEHKNTGTVSIKNFYLRRIYRILPPLYVSMSFAFLLSLAVGTNVYLEGKAVLAQAAMISNYFFFTEGAALRIPLWSLAVEEHYYIFFPFIFLLFIRQITYRHMAMVFLALCVAALLLRYYYALFTPLAPYTYFWSHTRYDSILFGCILALWNNPVLDESAWRPHWPAAVAALLIMFACIAIRNQLFRDTLRYSLQGASLYVLFSFAVSSSGLVSKVLSNSYLKLIGKYSYSIYLIHLPIIKSLRASFPGITVPIVVLVAGALSLALSALMYRYVESYFSALRRKLHDENGEGAHPARRA